MIALRNAVSFILFWSHYIGRFVQSLTSMLMYLPNA